MDTQRPRLNAGQVIDIDQFACGGRRKRAVSPRSELRESVDLNFRRPGTARCQLDTRLADAGLRLQKHARELVTGRVGRGDDDAVLHPLDIEVAACSISAGGILRSVGRIGQQDADVTGAHYEIVHFEAVHAARHQARPVVEHPVVNRLRIFMLVPHKVPLNGEVKMAQSDMIVGMVNLDVVVKWIDPWPGLVQTRCPGSCRR
jgi:hypothetical protein